MYTEVAGMVLTEMGVFEQWLKGVREGAMGTWRRDPWQRKQCKDPEVRGCLIRLQCKEGRHGWSREPEGKSGKK